MPDNRYINKVIYGGSVLLDLTGDDVQASDVQHGKIFHLPSGETATGTCTYDADTSDATATAAEILATKTAYKNGNKLTGTMPNNGAASGTISTKTGRYVIANGYHDGSGFVEIQQSEQTKLVPDNIREGITILGVEGTMSGSEDIKATSVTVTPYITGQVIVPTDLGDYNAITQVTVNEIAYTEVNNAAGGLTATIGTVPPSP